MKKIQILIIALTAAAGAHSQQLANSSFYEMHGIMHNAATVGSQKHLVVGGSFRTQWSGMPGSPKTGLVYGTTYLEKSRLGFGAAIYSDVAGSLRNTGLQLNVAYYVPFQNNTSLSFGFRGMLDQFSIDRAKLQAAIPGDPVLAGSENRFKADAGFGVALTGSNFQFGVGVNQLLQSKLGLYEGTGTVTEEGKHYRHFYFHGNYGFALDDFTRLVPNFLVTYLPNAPVETLVAARVEHNNLFWYGIGYRARQSWSLSAGLKFKQRFNVGYTFDMFRTPLSTYDGGANGHEVMLRYAFLK